MGATGAGADAGLVIRNKNWLYEKPCKGLKYAVSYPHQRRIMELIYIFFEEVNGEHPPSAEGSFVRTGQ
jgi:hypothetical protein